MKLFRRLFGKLAKNPLTSSPPVDPRDIVAEMIAMDILKELPEFGRVYESDEMYLGENRRIFEVRLKNITFKIMELNYSPTRYIFEAKSMYEAVGFYFTFKGDQIVNGALQKCHEIHEERRRADITARIQQKAIDFIEKRLKLDANARPEPKTGYEGMKMSELLALMKEKEHLSEEEQRQINAEILRLQKFVVTEKKFR